MALSTNFLLVGMDLCETRALSPWLRAHGSGVWAQGSEPEFWWKFLGVFWRVVRLQARPSFSRRVVSDKTASVRVPSDSLVRRKSEAPRIAIRPPIQPRESLSCAVYRREAEQQGRRVGIIMAEQDLQGVSCPPSPVSCSISSWVVETKKRQRSATGDSRPYQERAKKRLAVFSGAVVAFAGHLREKKRGPKPKESESRALSKES